jgi:putative transposase
MPYEPLKHHRKSIRLKGYDYAQAGMYYVTIVVKHRQHRFGRVINGTVEHSPLGLVADACWKQIPQHHVGVGLDEYVVMPNHVHGIVIINDKQDLGVDRRDVRRGGVSGGDVPCKDVPCKDVPCKDVQLNVLTGMTNTSNVLTGMTNTSNVLTGVTNTSNVLTGMTNTSNVPNSGGNDKRRRAVNSMSPEKGSLSVIIRTFKAAVTTWARRNGCADFAWLGRFHDHIIRDEKDLNRIRAYIRNNPLNWLTDDGDPHNDPKWLE